MESKENNQTLSIGIIGGGKAGLQLFDLFINDPRNKIAFVVDRDTNAPAIKAAHEKGIPGFNDIAKALSNHKVNILFEVTGSNAVVAILKQLLSDDTQEVELVTHQTLQMILSAIDNSNQEIRDTVSQDITAIRDDISNSLDSISNLMENVEDITADMRILGLNARIEAARAGEAGKGFEVVAEQMTKSVDDVRNIVQEMMGVNTKIKAIANQVDVSLQKLR